MQLRLQTLTREQMERCWAFAARQSTRTKLDDSVITSCSPEARQWGVRAGMCYEDAKLLVPDLKVLVYKGR